MIGITLNEPPANNGAWTLEQELGNLSIHDKFLRANSGPYTSSLFRNSHNVWRPTSDTIHFPLTNNTTGTVYNALSEQPSVNGEVNGGRVVREDTSSPSLGNQPAAQRRSTASQRTATTTARTRDIIILSDPEDTCPLYTCSTDRSMSNYVTADLQDCFGLDARKYGVGISSLLRRLGLATRSTAEDNTIGQFVSDDRKVGLRYLTLQLELRKNVEMEDYELGINQDPQAQELFQTLREKIGGHWSNIQYLTGLRNVTGHHYATMVLLQNSVMSIDSPDAENMVDNLISTLRSPSVPLSRDARAWKVKRLGTSLHDINNQGGHTVRVPLEGEREGGGEEGRGRKTTLTFNVSLQSDVDVAGTVTKFVGHLFSGFTGDDWSKPGLLQYYPSADVVKIAVGLLNRDRAEGEFELMFRINLSIH